MEDEILLENFLNGSMDSFEVLMNKYRDIVLSFAYFHTKNKSDADDIAQEVFIRFFKKAHTIKNKTRIKSWLYKTGINIIRDYYRAKKKDNTADYETFADSMELMIGGIEHAEKMVLLEAIDRLDKSEKDLIYMKYFNGLTGKEISGIIDKSENNVKVMLYRVRKKLFELMEGKENNMDIKNIKELLDNEKWGEINIDSSDFDKVFYRKLVNTMRRQKSIFHIISYASFLIAFLSIVFAVSLFAYRLNNTFVIYVYREASGGSDKDIFIINRKTDEKYKMIYDQNSEFYTFTAKINKKEIDDYAVISEPSKDSTYYVIDYTGNKKHVNIIHIIDDK